MPNIKNWSTTAANNNSSPPNGWPENMQLSDVNNSARQNMADVRGFADELPFIDYGHTPTRTGATTFTVPTDLTTTYVAGRRIKCIDSSTLYGTIASSSYGAPDTTVTVTLDSGSLTASLSAVALGTEVTNKAVSASSIKGGALDAVPIGTTTRAAIQGTTGNFNALITATAGINPNASGGVSLTDFDINQYTPTLTNVTNVAASTAFSTNYVRWNNYCAVFGRVDIDPTSAAAVELGMTLPVASNFSSSIQLGGGAWCTAINQHLAIVPDSTNDRLSFQGVVTDTSNRQYSFLVIYRII